MNTTLKPHSVVRYCGKNDSLRTHFSAGLSVLDTIPAGLPIGNGEVNRSGEDMVRCKSLYSGATFLFKRSELENS